MHIRGATLSCTPNIMPTYHNATLHITLPAQQIAKLIRQVANLIPRSVTVRTTRSAYGSSLRRS